MSSIWKCIYRYHLQLHPWPGLFSPKCFEWETSKFKSQIPVCFLLLSEFPWEVCVSLWDHVCCSVMSIYAIHLLTSSAVGKTFWPPTPLPKKESHLVYCTPLYSCTCCFTLDVCVVCSDPSSQVLFAFNSDSYAKTEKKTSLKGKIHPLCFVLTGVKLDLFFKC